MLARLCGSLACRLTFLSANQQQTFLVEIKTTSKKRLTKLQADFFLKWCGGMLFRIDSPEAALRMLKEI